MISDYQNAAALHSLAKTVPEVWYAWPFDASNASLVAGWSFWIAVVGLLVSLAGFAFTIVQLRKTKSAADAAKAEAERIQKSLVRYEVVNEATRASTALSTARNYLRAGLWPNVADSYETVCMGLEALKAEATDLTDEHRARIDVASKYIQNLCRRIEAGIQRNNISIDAAKTVSVMTEHKMLLSEITRVIEKGVIQ